MWLHCDLAPVGWRCPKPYAHADPCELTPRRWHRLRVAWAMMVR